MDNSGILSKNLENEKTAARENKQKVIDIVTKEARALDLASRSKLRDVDPNVNKLSNAMKNYFKEQNEKEKIIARSNEGLSGRTSNAR